MTQYRTYIDSDITAGLETIQSIQTNGTEYGIGISSDVVCNNISAGIITATQINGIIVGVSTLSVGYASTAGIATYASTSGISTVSQGLTGAPNITVGIITASVYSIPGSTSDLQGSAGTTTVDSNTTAVHYVTYNTNNTSVNISNFTSGKEFKLFVSNTAGGNRSLVIRTSTTTTGHATVPTLVHFATATITNGTINAASGTGYLLILHNIGGTIIGNY